MSPGNSEAPSPTCTSIKSKFKSCLALPSLYSRADLNISLLPFPHTWNIAVQICARNSSSCNGECSGERWGWGMEKVYGVGGTSWASAQHLWVSVLPPGLLACGGSHLPHSGPQSLNFYGGGTFMFFLPESSGIRGRKRPALQQ